MDTVIAVIEWSSDGVRAYNPATRQAASGSSVGDVLNKIGSPSRVGLCLGRRVSFVRESHTPDTDKNEARLVVTLQLESLFAGIEEELAFDFLPGSHMHEDGLQTVVAAARADTLRTALKEVEAAGVKVDWVAPVAIGAQMVASKKGCDDAIVVASSNGHLNLDVVRHRHLIYSRSVIDPESPKARAGEVARTLAASGIPRATTIAVEGTELSCSATNSELGDLEAMSSHNGHSLSIELPETVAKRTKGKAQTKVRLALIMWVAVIAIAAYVYSERADKAGDVVAADKIERARTRTYEKALSGSSSRLASVQSSQEKLDLAFSPSQPVYDVMMLIGNAVPKGVWLTGVTHERGKPILIRGTAVESDAVSAYTAALALSDRFRDVQLLFANNTEIESTPVVQFSIQAHVVGNLPITDDSSRRTRR